MSRIEGQPGVLCRSQPTERFGDSLTRETPHLTPYATRRFATATNLSLALQSTAKLSFVLQICHCYNTVHQKRNDQNIVLWLGTLRHGDFSAKTSFVLQIARKSSKSYFAEAAKTSFVLWLAAKTVLFLQTNLRVASGVSKEKYI